MQISFVLFSFEDLTRVGTYVKSMFVPGEAGLVDARALYLLNNYWVMLVILIFAATNVPKRLAERLLSARRSFSRKRAAGERGAAGTGTAEAVGMAGAAGASWYALAAQALFLAGVFLLSVAYLVDATYNPFLYFRF